MHTSRCRFAKTPEEKCKCSCRGALHGLEQDIKLDPNERILTKEDGGEIKEFIEKYENKKYICSGHHTKKQNNVHTANTFYGYLHDGGLADKNGDKWWVFVYCPVSRYQTSFIHLRGDVEKAENLNQYVIW